MRFIRIESDKIFCEGNFFSQKHPEKNVCGAFWPETWKHDGALIPLKEYEQGLIAHIGIRKGEKVFRYFTDTSLIANLMPLVKVNYEKGLVYFKCSEENELLAFEKKGVPVKYLVLKESVI